MLTKSFSILTITGPEAIIVFMLIFKINKYKIFWMHKLLKRKLYNTIMKLARFESRGEKEKKEKRRSLFWGIFIILIMTLSSVGYAIFSGEKTATNEQTEGNITKTDYGYRINTDYGFLNTKFTLENVSDVVFKGSLTLDEFQNKVIYIIADSTEAKRAASEFVLNVQTYAYRMQSVCTDNPDYLCEDENLPIKSCSELDDTSLMFLFNTKAGKSEVEILGKCVYIYESEENFMKSTDKLLFNIFNLKQ